MVTLVTGGAGFIGSQVAARLAAQNENIVIVDNFDNYYDPAIKQKNVAGLRPQVPIFTADIRDTDAMADIFKAHNVTRVVHMAGQAGVRNSIEQGAMYADVNTTGSVGLMNLARQHDVSVFVQASTSSVYGNTQRIPFTEDELPDFPLAPYPASKRAAELFAHSYYQLFGLNTTVLRFFNVYGPNGRPDMMPLRVIDAILHDRTIPIYDAGKLERDWTYIHDVVDGVVAALDKPLGFEIINLGYGHPTPLTRFIEIYEGLIGKKAITEAVPTPASEPRITYCDNTRARKLLGFDPQTPIADGLAQVWAWYRQAKGI